ncbi:hypothetical protein LLG95_01835 [bacterium]|nr:hypothetical protein [bacterium]
MNTKTCLCIIALAALLAGGSRALAGSQSAHYVVSIDAVASGGGSSASSHYMLLDSSAGQDSPALGASSGTKKENSGVIQYWPFFKNAARDWTCYE